ncbi:hypothetical protein NUW54_g11938 [Trametes sanguinea]|uniref:Uncharacterized protein n=1 Tax=Trametes sanguinea TaxID=158606 RepID=A0ACC1N584_9APHY|nr:hypothetical protein NUW54_g11938 [Trametes sanguinea]
MMCYIGLDIPSLRLNEKKAAHGGTGGALSLLSHNPPSPLPPPYIFLFFHLDRPSDMVNNLSVSIPSSPGSPSTPPSLTMSSPTSPQRSNTMVIAHLPESFFEPEIQDALRSHFQSYGPLHTWAPIRGLKRVFIVFYSAEDAETAKESNDGLILGDTLDARDVHNHYLDRPVNEKNFLISPPGSPPVGTEQILARVDELARADADAARGLENVYIMTNGAVEWVDALKAALRATGRWKNVASSRDLVLNWEQKYVAQAVDMLIGQRAQMFVGNGVRVFSSVWAVARWAVC